MTEFDLLLDRVRESYATHQNKRLSRPGRRRHLGGGRSFALGIEERLLTTLMFYRLHVTGLLLSYLFNLDESNLWRERNWRMMPVLLDILPIPMQDHLLSSLDKPENKSENKPENKSRERAGTQRKRIGTLEELLKAYPELRDITVDATEQQVPRPKDNPKNQKNKKFFYSGKSHRHTLKSQITGAGRLILHVMGGCPGAIADRQVLKASGVIDSVAQAAVEEKVRAQEPTNPTGPDNSTNPTGPRRILLDRGYSGIEKQYLNSRAGRNGKFDPDKVQILASLKGTSRSKVTLLGKAWNRAMIARQRMQIEQNIGHLKNWKVLSGIYRSAFETHEKTLLLVAGLHNFTILGALQWEK